MRKWIKRLMLLLALFLVSILAVVYGGFRMFKGVPQWYRHIAFSPAQREILASHALNELANIQNAAALARRNEMAGDGNALADSPVPIDVSFSDDELNAFFEKWENYANWKSNYERYVEDPLILIQQNRLILAGQVTDLGAVVSLQFDAQINPQGKLALEIDRVLAGRLPVPDMIIARYRDRLTAHLRVNLPRWRQGAAIGSDGAANSDLISASMARLFLHMLDHTPADPVLFLPLVERHANVPVRVCAVMVEDHNLKMTVLPLDAKERAALLSRIRADESGVP
jgi:uncharacterized protein YpmS